MKHKTRALLILSLLLLTGLSLCLPSLYAIIRDDSDNSDLGGIRNPPSRGGAGWGTDTYGGGGFGDGVGKAHWDAYDDDEIYTGGADYPEKARWGTYDDYTDEPYYPEPAMGGSAHPGRSAPPPEGPRVPQGEYSDLELNMSGLEDSYGIQEDFRGDGQQNGSGENVDQESRVPLLGDLPIIGGSFRSTAETSDAENLPVIVTPQIVQTHEDSEN